MGKEKGALIGRLPHTSDIQPSTHPPANQEGKQPDGSAPAIDLGNEHHRGQPDELGPLPAKLGTSKKTSEGKKGIVRTPADGTRMQEVPAQTSASRKGHRCLSEHVRREGLRHVGAVHSMA